MVCDPVIRCIGGQLRGSPLRFPQSKHAILACNARRKRDAMPRPRSTDYRSSEEIKSPALSHSPVPTRDLRGARLVNSSD